MQRVALINGKNKNQDYDLSKIFSSIANPGVVEGLEVQSGKVTAGYAFIEVDRAGVKFNILFQNTEDLVIDTTGTKKVFIEINQSNIDDGTSNFSDGTGIGEIKTASSYPVVNFISLASITSGVINDERTFVSSKDGLDLSKANNYTVTSVNSNYTFTGNEENQTGFSTTTTSGNITYSLNPALFPNTKGLYEFTFCKFTADTNKVIIDVGSGKTIDGNQTYELKNQYETVTIKIVDSNFVKVVATSNKSIDTGIEGSEDFLAGETLVKGNSIFNDRYVTSVKGNNVFYIGRPRINPSSSSTTVLRGIQIANNGKFPYLLKSIQTINGVTGNRCNVYDRSGNLLLGTCTITSNYGTFSTPIYIPAGGKIKVLVDSSGSTYTSYYDATTSFQMGDITVEGGVEGATAGITGNFWNVYRLEAEKLEFDEHNIGDVAANKKLSIPFLGSGIASNSIGLSIKKFGSPSFPIQIRLETDNAGSPSGTLIDANATATQSVVGGLIADESHLKSFGLSYGAYTTPIGVKILTKTTGYIKSFFVTSNTYCDRAFLKDNSGNILATGFVVNQKGFFNEKVLLQNNTNYRIEVDRSGVSTHHYYNSSGGAAYTGTYINYVAGSNNGTDVTSYLIDIESIEFETEINTVFTFPNNVLINKGSKFWVVLNQNLEVVDVNNYYKLIMSKEHTKIDIGKLYNTSWSNYSVTTTESMPISYGHSSNGTVKTGCKIISHKNVLLNYIVKGASCTATKFYISSNSKLLASGTFSGNNGVISGGLFLQAGNSYNIEFDANGVQYSSRYHSSYSQTSFISSGGKISFSDGLYEGSSYSYIWSLRDLNITDYNLENRQGIISNLVLNGFISKTSSNFSYKVGKSPLFAGKNISTGGIVTIIESELVKLFSGLDIGNDYFVGSEYGSISKNYGFVKQLAGKAVSSSSLLKYLTIEQSNGVQVQFSSDSSIAQTVKITHNLGVIPKVIFVTGNHPTSYSSEGMYINGKQSCNYYEGTTFNYSPSWVFRARAYGTITEVTENDITLSISGNSSGTYYLFFSFII